MRRSLADVGQWWPFSLAKNEFDRFETETNGLLKDVVKKTIEELEAAKAAGDKTADELTRIDNAIASITADQKRLAERYKEVTTKLAPGSARMARVGEINTEITNWSSRPFTRPRGGSSRRRRG